MKINNCPACNGPAAIRYTKGLQGFHVWIQCKSCGFKTREFDDKQEPTENITGGKFAIIAWNAAKYTTT